MLVGNGDRVICRCKNNQVFATSRYSGNRGLAARFASTLLAEGSPIQHAQAAKKSPVEASAETPPPEPLPLPARIYETRRQMDDYKADDMHYGDLTEEELKRDFGLIHVSQHVDPFQGVMFIPYKQHNSPYPITAGRQSISLQTSAEMLFDEFRSLSDMFSWTGEYKGLIRKMITHMQYGNGTPFSDPLLDKAMKEQILNDKSEGSTLSKIKQVLSWNISFYNGYYPLIAKDNFKEAINSDVKLPMFDDLMDRINGLGISVHDTWATHITLQSLLVNGDDFEAEIHFHIQDHFGLDNEDIRHWLYQNVRIFSIWFILQRWDRYAFRPFITEINVIVKIKGTRNE